MRKPRHDPRDPNDSVDKPVTQTEIVHAEQGTVQPTETEQSFPTTVEIHRGMFKALESCSPTDFFCAHLLAKERATAYMKSAEFMLAAADYYKKLSQVPQ